MTIYHAYSVLFSHFVLLDLMISRKSNMPKRWLAKWRRAFSFSIHWNAEALYTLSYQNGSFLKLNAAVQTMSSDVMLTIMERNIGCSYRYFHAPIMIKVSLNN